MDLGRSAKIPGRKQLTGGVLPRAEFESTIQSGWVLNSVTSAFGNIVLLSSNICMIRPCLLSMPAFPRMTSEVLFSG